MTEFDPDQLQPGDGERAEQEMASLGATPMRLSA